MTQKALRLFPLIDPFALLGVRTDATVLLCFAEGVYHRLSRLSSGLDRKIFQLFFSLHIFAYFACLLSTILTASSKCERRQTHGSESEQPEQESEPE